jgi:hypothetical protein
METQKSSQNSSFNRGLLVILVGLFILTIVVILALNWTSAGEGMPWWMALVNALILSIPLGLIYASIYVLVRAWHTHVRSGRLDVRLGKIVHWAPRLAAIAVIFFISLFSLDVFDTQATIWQLLGGFLIHNIPSIVLFILLFFAWKRPQVGFWAFLVAGVLFVIFFVRSIYALSNFILFVVPLWLIAGLFYADWRISSPAQS